MQQIRLKEKVDITGPDFWGRKAKLSFLPTLVHGWHWKTGVELIIDPEIATSRLWRTALSYYDRRLNIYEHIGVLRWFGLCNLFIESTPWFPYFGRPLELWRAVNPHCQNDSEEIKWYTIKKSVCWKYPKCRNGQEAFTKIYPHDRPELRVRVTISYPGLGTTSLGFCFPNKHQLEALCAVYNQGWPKCLYYFSKIASLFGWPHHNSATWVQELGKRNALQLFAEHRVVDLLGDLSLLCRDGLLAAQVISCCSGHEADIEVIRKANKLICPLN